MAHRISITKQVFSRKTATQSEQGFTLIEMLVALGIIVLVATIATPQVMRYMGKARTETARAQISAISTALELYSLDLGGFPQQQLGLQALMQNSSASARWKGPYLKRADALLDPWGRPYLYRFPGKSGQAEVYSLGRDSAPGGVDEDQDLASW
jgi:general secretion pathway protein G